MEVLIALSLTGLVFLLATDHIGTLVRGWFQMRELRSDLTAIREIEAVLAGFADEVDGRLLEQTNGTQTLLTTSDQGLLLDPDARSLVWNRQIPVTISLPEPASGWRLDYDEAAASIFLKDGDHSIASARLQGRIPLPCSYDAISRRCLGAAN
ncbi:hypothetical protein [Hyphobacterium sp.]|uniref:hypothetical protein n=1 Tax=Hyphobacterium sp. TaxID=2004662 RepID=UPI0037496ABA